MQETKRGGGGNATQNGMAEVLLTSCSRCYAQVFISWLVATYRLDYSSLAAENDGVLKTSARSRGRGQYSELGGDATHARCPATSVESGEAAKRVGSGLIPSPARMHALQ